MFQIDECRIKMLRCMIYAYVIFYMSMKMSIASILDKEEIETSMSTVDLLNLFITFKRMRVAYKLFRNNII